MTPATEAQAPKRIGESMEAMLKAQAATVALDAALAEARAAFSVAEATKGAITSELLESLVGAMAEMSMAGKSGNNTFDRYRYGTLEDYLDAVRGPLLRHGLVLTSFVAGDAAYSTRKVKSGADEVVVRVPVETRVWHAQSGGWIAVRVTGEGQDRGDKALYKALTGARKYGIAMLCGIYTTDDPEEDNRPATRDEAPAREPLRSRGLPGPGEMPQPEPAADPAPDRLLKALEKRLAEVLVADGLWKALDAIATHESLGTDPARRLAAVTAVISRGQQLQADGAVAKDEGTRLVTRAVAIGNGTYTGPDDTHQDYDDCDGYEEDSVAAGVV
ncbi:MAG: ERF family protein [Lacipirellulaceae bacterium]